jgi:hypothetical protein
VNSALTRRLRREAAANPAKAGALALVLLIALWFWTPLIIHWCSPASGSTDATVAPSVTAEQSSPPSSATGKTVPAGGATPPPAEPWQQLLQRIEQDPHMRPSRRSGGSRNPFGPSAAALAAAKVSQEKTNSHAPPPELLPADAGLVLNSTLVGSGRRMALIGGEPYFEGDVVPASHGSEGFRLIGIFPRRVELQRQGKNYGLEIKSTSPSGRDTPLTSDSEKPRNATPPRNVPQRNPAQHNGKAATGRDENGSSPFTRFNVNQ